MVQFSLTLSVTYHLEQIVAGLEVQLQSASGASDVELVAKQVSAGWTGHAQYQPCGNLVLNIEMLTGGKRHEGL